MGKIELLARMPPEKPRVFLMLLSVVLTMLACNHGESEGPKGAISERSRQDLLIGYELLENTLSDESRLGTLELFKTLMLDAPNEAIGKIMKKLSDASKERAAELSKLRRLTPSVSDKPQNQSPMGDAINDIAKEFGKSEMLSRAGGFDVRFVLLQAQATRMVAAMATATERFDPNPKRKVWLKDLAREYEGYRADLIEYLGGKAARK